MDVAQLVEPRVVIPAVVGSSPIVHPNLESANHGPLAQLVEQETLNLLVVGSIPTRPTKPANQLNHFAKLRDERLFHAVSTALRAD